MVKKRGQDRIERITRKRPAISKSDFSCSLPKDRNAMNDRMMMLYKENLSGMVKASLTDNEAKKKEDDSSIKSAKENPKPPDSSKVASKLSKATRKKEAWFSALTPQHSSVTFEDVGGLDNLLKDLLNIMNQFYDNQFFTKFEVQSPKGLLLHGPPGCGKTHLARAIAGELDIPYIEVAATDLVCGISGESESKIRDMFDAAVKSAPCILFIDEIDAISPKRDEAEKGMEKRMVSQLLTCFNDLVKKEAQIMVIGATNRIDSMDIALRRGGRFDCELAIQMPDKAARLKILEILCKKLSLAPDVNMQWLAHHTPGYNGADLKLLISNAINVCYWRTFRKCISDSFSEDKGNNSDLNAVLSNIKGNPQLKLGLDSARLRFKSKFKIPEKEYKNVFFELADFQVAIKNYVPNSVKEGFVSVTDVTLDDIGALDVVKKELQSSILRPIKCPEKFESLNIPIHKGILLYGPKGCGKTLLAKAIANEGSLNFLSVKGSELFSKYFGESEKNVKNLFRRAKNSAPCVIFFDEIDALCSERSNSNENEAANRVVNALLTEMDGIEDRKQVFVLAATNRLEKIDSAMLRPGRFDKIVPVYIPSAQERVEILKRLSRNKTKPKIADSVDLELIGHDIRCKNFSGADLANLLVQAGTILIDECFNSGNENSVEPNELKPEHFEHALSVVKASITNEEQEYFKRSLKKINL